MKVTPIGAAGEVTGSCFLVETDGMRLLIDCGMFQGHQEEESRNDRFPFEPSEIDAVLLTHAHLDHCGRLPALHAQGFRGQVYATPSTCDLAQFIMLDAAKLQEEDFIRRRRKFRRSGYEVGAPLYDTQDVLHLLRYFHAQPYGRTFTLGNLKITFHQSGHILGSAAIEIRERYASVLFSGDLGSPGRNVVPDPTPAPEVDLVFCESTYGDRLHRSEADSVAELRDAINWAYQAGGNVIIPSFALERTQDLIFHLRDLRLRGEVPHNPVYMDSPLAINITKVYEHHPSDLDEATRAVIAQRDDPFRFDGMTSCSSPDESRAVNGKDRIIIIAGSGMCQGGRVVHHLRHNLWREDTAVVFIGYQAVGTLGRRIVDGAPTVNIEREPVAVKARVFTINGFSAHADQPSLINWLSTTGSAHIVLNHGETSASAVLAKLLAEQGRNVEVARLDRVYDTDALPVAK
ncbi:MAG: MBL fold metallo-hydrolase [Armatimonadota bacterium]